MLVHALIVKKNLFQAIPFSQTDLIQTLHFSISIVLSTHSWMSKQFYLKQFSLA